MSESETSRFDDNFSGALMRAHIRIGGSRSTRRSVDEHAMLTRYMQTYADLPQSPPRIVTSSLSRRLEDKVPDFESAPQQFNMFHSAVKPNKQLITEPCRWWVGSISALARLNNRK
ncbi:hypothetical protein AJ80_00764 [Polytolypa hystricis UAMH7299]|uniref:Uncharacterized protein n=1 Tax=Polytolypa hystricis (strain UAMH7299) TaxID=1447883 RepID=A0A2B7Z2S2_POLH7|nr:hypothetical protein AJ80_00764 [Polytolypa hystricis UAMH7299]